MSSRRVAQSVLRGAMACWLATGAQSCARDRSRDPAGSPPSKGSASGILAATAAGSIDAYVKPFEAGRNFSGTILVAKGRRIAFLRSYGKADAELGVANSPRTKFAIASITKTFTAAAVLLLAERGALSVTDRVSRFIPDYPHGDAISLHQLLSHTSGVKNFFEVKNFEAVAAKPHTLPQLIASFAHEPLYFAPGASYHYSNSNYALLAFVIEQVSHRSYAAFLEHEILGPLGLGETVQPEGEVPIAQRAKGYTPTGADGIESARPVDSSILVGSGSLYSTAEDLLAWDRALHSSTILGARSRSRMFMPYQHDMGYGWFVRKKQGRDVVEVNGELPGFTSSLIHFTAEDLVVIVLSNNNSMLSSQLADGVAAIALGEPQPNVQIASLRVDRGVVTPLLGRYRFGEDFYFSANLVAVVGLDHEGRLRMDVKAASPTYLYPQPDGSFVDRLFGGKVSFGRDAHGRATRLVWDLGQTFVAERLVDEPRVPGSASGGSRRRQLSLPLASSTRTPGTTS